MLEGTTEAAGRKKRTVLGKGTDFERTMHDGGIAVIGRERIRGGDLSLGVVTVAEMLTREHASPRILDGIWEEE